MFDIITVLKIPRNSQKSTQNGFPSRKTATSLASNSTADVFWKLSEIFRAVDFTQTSEQPILLRAERFICSLPANRSNRHRRSSIKNGVLKNFAKFTEKASVRASS